VLPEHFQLFPSIPHTVERNVGGIAEIIIPKLVPDEQITVSYLYFPPLLWSQIHACTKSDEDFAKILTVLPTQLPKWKSRAILALIFIPRQRYLNNKRARANPMNQIFKRDLIHAPPKRRHG
jgi:hypothetical protein